MRPPKPRIAKPRLKWAWNGTKAVWEPYHRVTWTADGKRKERAILLAWGGDAAELDRLYWECEAGRHVRQKPPAPRHSWGAAVIAWRTDPRVQGRLADGTKRSYRRTMDAILEKNRDKAMAKTTRQGLRKVHDALSDTPRRADHYLQVVSLLWNYAVEKLDWPLGPNPAKGIELFGRQRSFEPWPAWMVKALADAPSNVRTAAELIMGTGQRPAAAIAMRHDQFAGDWMTVTDEKQDEMIETFCPADLRAYLAELPKRGAHVIAKNLTEPLSYDAVEKAFRAWRATLRSEAAEFSLHGLRKLAIIRLAEAGCSDAEIQSVTNQSAETVAYYRARASRKRLSRSAHERKNPKRTT